MKEVPLHNFPRVHLVHLAENGYDVCGMKAELIAVYYLFSNGR